MSQRKPHMWAQDHLTPLDRHRLRQQAIGVRLRMHFDDILMAPVPEEWLELLRQADERIAQGG